MVCSTPGSPILSCLLEFAQAYVHWVGEAIQPSHPLSPPSPAFNVSQPQGPSQCIGSSHQVAKILELQLQHQFFNEYSGLISFRIDWVVNCCQLQSLLLKGLSRVFSSITVQKRHWLQRIGQIGNTFWDLSSSKILWWWGGGGESRAMLCY